MNTKEFRIGNWVLVPTNYEIKIPCYPKQIKGITLLGELDFSEPHYPETCVMPAKDCSGVELTEELLLKCGFVFFELPISVGSIYGISPKGSPKSYLLKTDCCKHTGFYDYHYGNRVEYLHQLQNLYFAHTGKELDVQF